MVEIVRHEAHEVIRKEVVTGFPESEVVICKQKLVRALCNMMQESKVI